MKLHQTEIAIPRPHPTERGHMPAWVTDMLAQESKPLARRGILDYCHRCKEIIIVGLDADIAGWKVIVDPTPLTAKQELACYLAGRRTWSLTIANRTLTLDVRDAGTCWPPERSPFHVVPRHQCGARFPGFVIPPVAPDAGKHPPF